MPSLEKPYPRTDYGAFIVAYALHFRRDRQISAVYSFSTQFGKLLARNAVRHSIVMTFPELGHQGDHSQPTTTTDWEFAAALGTEGSSMQT